jgi:hypothetical protein
MRLNLKVALGKLLYRLGCFCGVFSNYGAYPLYNWLMCKSYDLAGDALWLDLRPDFVNVEKALGIYSDYNIIVKVDGVVIEKAVEACISDGYVVSFNYYGGKVVTEGNVEIELEAKDEHSV